MRNSIEMEKENNEYLPSSSSALLATDKLTSDNPNNPKTNHQNKQRENQRTKNLGEQSSAL
jgi:hypothetical protein